MTDLARLTEALDFWGQVDFQKRARKGPPVLLSGDQILDFMHSLEAARLVVDGKPGWYCETHEQWDWNDARCWVADMGPGLCRMVDAVLVFPKAGT